MTGATRIAALAGGSALAVFAAMRWLGGDAGAPDDVGRVAIRDVLIERDAAVHEGRLEGCNASSCELDGRRFARSGLAFIGLGVESATPSPVEDPSQDELHLRGGGVVHEDLAQIDEDAVFVGARRFERNEVEWVALAAEAEPPGPQAGHEAPPPRPYDGGDRRDDDDDRSDEDAPSTPREPNPELVKPCPADLPLGGEIEYGYDTADRHYQRCSGSARLWFRLHTAVMAWPYPAGSSWESDAISYRLENHGCTDLPDLHGEICTAPPQAEIRGRVMTVGPAGRPVTFYPLTPELDFVVLPDELYHGPKTPVTCVNPGGGGSGSWEFPVIGAITARGRSACSDSSHCAAACVQPTLCTDATDPEQTRDCSGHPDRYAVIPFAGSQRTVCDDGAGTVNTWRFRWKVCCGCGEPPSGPPPEFTPRPPDDCEDAAAELAALIGRMRGLAAAYRSHEDAFACAQRRRDEWRDKVWGLGGSLTGFSATLPGTAPGAGPRYQGLAALLPALHRLLSGDTSALSQVETAIDVVANDDVMNQAQSRALQMLRRAFRAWYEHVSRGADLRQAARAYKEQVRHIKEAFGDVKQAGKALQPVLGLIDMAYAASNLADHIAGYAEWRKQAQDDQQAMEDAQDQMRDVQLELDRLRARCPDLPPPPREEPPPTPASHCPERPGGSGGGEPSASVLPEPASPALGGFALAATGGSSPEADLAALRQQFSALSVVEERAVARTADEILPLLAPFLFHQTEDLSQDLVLELLADARPHLEALVADLDEAAALGREIESAARRLAPQSAGSSVSARAP